MGFDTAIGRETGVARSMVDNTACKWEASTNVVRLALPATVTAEAGLKPEPVTVIVNGPTPSSADAGTSRD
jgi:hypothetical protein